MKAAELNRRFDSAVVECAEQDDLVPLVDRKLAGHEGGSLGMAVVEDLQQVANRPVAKLTTASGFQPQ